MNVGTRVKVDIKKPEQWAYGAVESLQGKEGAVARTKEVLDHERSMGETLKVLVEFDAPARGWSTHQTPPTAHWFDATELEVLP